MPHTPRHRQQRTKNITLLALLVGLVVVLFSVSYIKMTAQVPENAPAAPDLTNDADTTIE